MYFDLHTYISLILIHVHFIFNPIHCNSIVHTSYGLKYVANRKQGK